MFPSKFLAAADLEDQDKTYTIATVEQEIVGQGDEAEQKWVVYFQETTKGMVLNKTNGLAISGALGDDTDAWIGHQVVLFPTEVSFGSKMVEAIRVREKHTRVLLQQALKRTASPAAKSNGAAARPGKPAPVMTQADADKGDANEEIPF